MVVLLVSSVGFGVRADQTIGDHIVTCQANAGGWGRGPACGQWGSCWSSDSGGAVVAMAGPWTGAMGAAGEAWVAGGF
jgi:hypothetical protein